MKLSEVKQILKSSTEVCFELPNGTIIPNHFHVTEVGVISKHFIDCGGNVRKENVVNFQLWEAGDYDHRLAPQKFMKIIELSEKTLEIAEDLEIEVEYQQNTIGKFGLDFNGKNFLLTNKLTACLAQDSCGIPAEKQKLSLSELTKEKAVSCAPGSGCCS